MDSNKRYDPATIKALALKVIAENQLRGMSEVVARMPVGHTTFYIYLPKGSDDFNEVERALLFRKAEMKHKMRENWQKETAAPNLQLAAYKLLADEDELEALGQVNKNNNANSGTLSAQIVIQSKSSDAPALAGSEDDIDMNKTEY